MLEGGRGNSRDQWLADRDVIRVAEAVVVGAHPMLVAWADEATTNDMRAALGSTFARVTDPSVLESARRIANHGAKIAARPSADWRNLRGAVLELIAAKLVERRGEVPLIEQKVRLNHLDPPGVSEYLDVAVDQDPFEAYECKASAGGLNDLDLRQLDSVRRSAVALGRGAAVGVATFSTYRALEVRLRQLSVPKGLRHLCRQDLLELGDMHARRPLAKSMAHE